MSGAKLTWERYQLEVVTRQQAVRVAELELQQAHNVLKMYTIHSRVNGVITRIYKHPGEAVKAFDPILQIRVED